jgi:Tol biopolymer transport system component
MGKENSSKPTIYALSIVMCFVIQQDIIVPGSMPKVFTQEDASTTNESAPTFTPDGNTVYLADNNTIRVSRKVAGKWMKPKDASFSGKWQDWDPFLSPDGKRLIFVSNRPLEGAAQDSPHKSNHLWYTDHLSGDDWSIPRHLDSPVNIEGINDYAPSVSRSGTLCFCSRNREGDKKMGAYYTRWLVDHYDKPRLLVLNGDNEVFDPFISPDERYIIFASNRNLYISFRQGNNWSPGQKLGSQVNNGSWNGGPYISPDGKMLYYAQAQAPGILMIPVNIPGE